MYDINKLSSKDLRKIVSKFEEFMQHCQKLKTFDTYLIVNRNSPLLANAAQIAAKNYGLDVKKFDLTANTHYENFPEKLVKSLQQKTPKAGIGLFNYSQNPDWNIKEVGARIKFLHQIIEQLPISWAHSPGITLDMAINGPLQCNYKKMAQDSQLLIQELQNTNRIRITAPGGTDLEIKLTKQVRFDTDCVIVPPNVYGRPGKFGNLPVGEVWSQKGEIIQVLNKETGQIETQHYPVTQIANGKLVCDVTVGGYAEKINPTQPIIVKFKDGILTDFQCKDPKLECIRKDILTSEQRYGLPTVLEEIGIGLNEKARITGNMLEDEKIRGTCHLAPGNIRSHVDMLVNNPTITVTYKNGVRKEIIRKGDLV
jgi:hypothetical protein